MARKTYDEMEIFEAIVEYKNKEGYTPTIRELQDMIGIKSSSTVHKYLKRLEESNLISMSTGKVRTILVTNDVKYNSEDFLKELRLLCDKYKYDIWIGKDKIELLKAMVVRSN